VEKMPIVMLSIMLFSAHAQQDLVVTLGALVLIMISVNQILVMGTVPVKLEMGSHVARVIQIIRKVNAVKLSAR